MEKTFDFSGWATRANLKCSDGRTILKDAFKDNDGKRVPLVWGHIHDDPQAVLGHAILENRNEGVYAYCWFNGTEQGQNAKAIVEHGDVEALSIFANQLKQSGADVVHGNIRELSLVLAGSNPGASIDSVIRHSDGSTQEDPEQGVIYTGEPIEVAHSADADDEPESNKDVEHADGEDETVGDVFNSLSEKQKAVVYAMLEEALKNQDEEPEKKDEEDSNMKHNLFDKGQTEETKNEDVLSHSDMVAIINDAKRTGSLRDAFIQHDVSDEALAHSVTDAAGNTVSYGVANIDYLFPDARKVNDTPDFISRDMDWVNKVIGGAKHLPFSRVKSVHANITMDEARAKGYVKGTEKANEVFSLLKRTTSPTTIYKKQKLDRDDIVDITDFNVVAWLKVEMRIMLNEEIARAALIGDGRVAGADYKISEDNIRPIYSDNSTYTVRKAVTVADGATDDDKAKAFIRNSIKARKNYKGSGNPSLFTTEDMLTDCLLLEDGNGRVIYDSMEKLRTTLRVKEIITVPVMENLTRAGSGDDAGYNFALMGIFVNMADYGFGADKGGAVNMFDDFDIDFNQEKYLIETRCSGALMKYHSAIVVELKTAAA